MPEYNIRDELKDSDIYKINFGCNGEYLYFDKRNPHVFFINDPLFEHTMEVISEDIQYTIEALEKLKEIMKEHNAI